MGSCFVKREKRREEIFVFDFKIKKQRKTGENDSFDSLLDLLQPEFPKLNLQENCLWLRRLKMRQVDGMR